MANVFLTGLLQSPVPGSRKKKIILKSTDTRKGSEMLRTFQDDAGNVTSAWCPCSYEGRDTPMTQQAAGHLLECDALWHQTIALIMVSPDN